jgi:hypothetical protein
LDSVKSGAVGSLSELRATLMLLNMLQKKEQSPYTEQLEAILLRPLIKFINFLPTAYFLPR